MASARSNIPPERTPFVGRERLLDALRGFIQQPAVRLITLTGPGGTGKTRVALRIAAAEVPHFDGGVFFVPLAPVSDPDGVAPAVARALGLKEAPGQPSMATICDHISDQPVLLVLDNFEQVLGAAPVIAGLLEGCPRLHVLVTSRAVLRLSGEQEFPIPPLVVPKAGPVAIAEVSTNEAVTLFVAQARATRPGFTLSAHNAADVAEVCRRLDGLPLALELAAARLRALPLPALLQRLERRLPLLTGGPRDAPARQRTLRDAIAWSYDLLSPREQALFRRLAVFRGFGLDALDEVCCSGTEGPGTSSIAAPALALDALEGASSLVEKSLLQTEDVEDGQPWYVMLETVREFALEELQASGEEAAIRRRHALYYLRLAESTDQALHGADQLALMGRLEREHANCREAMSWCGQQGYPEPALRTAVALWWFWTVRGYATEGRDRLMHLLERLAPPSSTGSRLRLRVRGLEAAGHLASFQGDLEAARSLHEQTLEVVEEQEDWNGLHRALQNLGFVARQQGDLAAAGAYLERCVAIAREHGADDEIGNALYNLGIIAHDLGDYERAQHLLEEALPRFVGNPEYFRAMGNAHMLLGMVERDRGDYVRARAETKVALDSYAQANAFRMVSLALANLASIAMSSGDFGAAANHLSDSLRHVQQIGDLVLTAEVLERFAVLLVTHGDHQTALRLAGAAASLRAANGAPLAPVALARFETEIKAAWEALGTNGHAAYAAGRALTPDAAAAEALLAVSPPGLAQSRSAPEPGNGHASAQPPPHLAGQPGPALLSAREQEIARLVASGATNRQIATSLVIAEGTAANHVLHILNKLGFSTRSQIAAWAVQHGLLPLVQTVSARTNGE